MNTRRLLIPVLLVVVLAALLLWQWPFDQTGDEVAGLRALPSDSATLGPNAATQNAAATAVEKMLDPQPAASTAGSAAIGPAKACIPFEQLSQTVQWQKAQEWLDGLGSGLLTDIVSNTRTSKLSHYLDYSPEQLTDLVARGDANAKLVKAELNYQQARKLAYARDDVNREQALQLIQEARQLWWDAVVDGGYTTALTNMGQSYYIEERILEQRGELTFNKRLELEKLSFRYGEAPEVLIDGLGDNFFEFGDMLAPVDVLQAALAETVAHVEAERTRRGLPSLRTKIPPERKWVMAQRICRD